MTRPPTFDDVAAAARRLEGAAIRTPLLNFPELDRRVGRRLWIKAETLQHGGAFKFRGAYNRLAQLDDEQRRVGGWPSLPATTRRGWRWRRGGWAAPR